jgi:PTH2 family peptidyl-tRNA hydrolase
MKLVIAVRSDLNMTRGKEAAQVAHAAVSATLYGLAGSDIKRWLASGGCKIVVSVDSWAALHDLMDAATHHGIAVHPVTDVGRTMFDGVPTLTCCALGPATSDQLDPITGGCKLR